MYKRPFNVGKKNGTVACNITSQGRTHVVSAKALRPLHFRKLNFMENRFFYYFSLFYLPFSYFSLNLFPFPYFTNFLASWERKQYFSSGGLRKWFALLTP